MKTKKALITGVSGQDGSLLAEFLLSKGYKVYGLMRELSSKDNLENIINNNNFYLIYGDILNNDLIKYILQNNKFDEIYNLASQSNIRLSYNDPINTFNTSLMGTIILLDNVKKYSPTSRIFQASSSAIFGNSLDKDGFQRETTPYNPISPYASAKLFSHNLCINYRNIDNLYVSNGILYNHESTKSKRLLGVVNNLVKNFSDLKNQKILEYYIPNLKIYLDIGNAQDYVEAMWLTLQPPHSNDYIISSGEVHSIKDICDFISCKLDFDYTKYIKTDSNNLESLKLKGDSTRLKNLGWKPKYSIFDTINELINYYDKF